MTSSGRYMYHLQDIAEIKAMSEPIHPIHKTRLETLEIEVSEFERENPSEAKRMQDLVKELANR